MKDKCDQKQARLDDPRPGNWRIHYKGELDSTNDPDPDVDFYIFDFEFIRNSTWDAVDEDAMRELTGRIADVGAKPIAYVSAHLENWRTDAASFTGNDILYPIGDWGGEFYVRDSANTKDILRRRFELIKRCGFVAVDVDNIDGHTNGTDLEGNYYVCSPDEGMAHVVWLIGAARDEGLGYGLKNAQDFIGNSTIADSVDFYVSEAKTDDDLLNYSDIEKPAVQMWYPGNPVTSFPSTLFLLEFPNDEEIEGGTPR